MSPLDSSGSSDDTRWSAYRTELLSLHAAVLLFGFAGLFGKWLALPPESIVLGRTLVAAVTLAALLRLARESAGEFEWRLAAGGAVLALHWVAFFHAVQVSSVAVGLLGFAIFPLFALIAEPVFLGRKLRLASRYTGSHWPLRCWARSPVYLR